MKNSGLGRLRVASAERQTPGLPAIALPSGTGQLAGGTIVSGGFVAGAIGDGALISGEYVPMEHRSAGAGTHAARSSLKKLLDRAIHAADVWNEAEHFGTLKDALADCAISVGTSRRRGRHRKSNTLTPRELAAFLKTKAGSAAIVFGNERTGLEREELELCNMASHIPVSPEFSSINLSHAVQIYAYELYQAFAETGVDAHGPGKACSAGTVKADCDSSRTGGTAAPGRFTGPAPVPGQWVPMSAAEIETLVQKISGSLKSLGFYKHPGREEQERFLRDLMSRAGLSLSEGRYFASIISKARHLGH
jgi:tRNA/rRNA methyltransferase/tRNA (cytidine32/uridine32-2'-O)-methyltransferase